jgi:hypothetical protein
MLQAFQEHARVSVAILPLVLTIPVWLSIAVLPNVSITIIKEISAIPMS